TLPYLIAPFKQLDDYFGLYDARTQMSLSFLTARREELSFVIRGRGAARLRLEMQHSPNVATYLDLIDLSLSNPDTLNDFSQKFLGSVLQSIEDPIQRAQVLQDYTEPQINSALRLTRRSANVNLLLRDQGYSYEGVVEIGGNLPFFIERFLIRPDSLEGRIPGLSLFRSGNSDNRLVYRQYARLSGDFRQYKPISPNSVLAWKLIGGFAHPTGQADLIPFDRRFYSGGATSVRGWGLRGLGPGRTTADSTSGFLGGNNSILGGDIKLEASVELRSTVLREVLAADWILALYGDAGNVWFGPRNPGDDLGRFRFSSFYKEIGVGTGFGLRLAWDYLILRLDLAYRVYDPSLSGGLFENSFKTSRLHFGIGHAF
ncbi:MAG: BamA/TamA family outer membrane protein, partial [Rhodothermales bacterium]